MPPRYFKFFDLIPQAVVLRIARELGMDDGHVSAAPAGVLPGGGARGVVAGQASSGVARSTSF